MSFHITPPHHFVGKSLQTGCFKRDYCQWEGQLHGEKGRASTSWQTCTHTAAEAPLVSLLSLSRSSSSGLPGGPRGDVGFMTCSKGQRDIGSGEMGLLSQGFWGTIDIFKKNYKNLFKAKTAPDLISKIRHLGFSFIIQNLQYTHICCECPKKRCKLTCFPK